MVSNLLVASIGLLSCGFLSMSYTQHVHWGMELQLGLVVVLLIVLVTLQFGYLHIVYQQRVVLNVTEANMLALGLVVSLFVLIL